MYESSVDFFLGGKCFHTDSKQIRERPDFFYKITFVCELTWVERYVKIWFMHQRTQFFGTDRIIIAGRCNERYCSQWLDPKGNGHEASFSGNITILTDKRQSLSCLLEHLGGFVVLLWCVNMLQIVLHLRGNRLYLLYHKSEIPGACRTRRIVPVRKVLCGFQCRSKFSTLHRLPCTALSGWIGQIVGPPFLLLRFQPVSQMSSGCILHRRSLRRSPVAVPSSVCVHISLTLAVVVTIYWLRRLFRAHKVCLTFDWLVQLFVYWIVLFSW